MPIKWNTIFGFFRKYLEAGSVAKQAISAIREALQPHTTHSYIVGVVGQKNVLFMIFNINTYYVFGLQFLKTLKAFPEVTMTFVSN